MEILIGLVVATVVLIGWGYGIWPVALFLTLADLFGMTLIGLLRNPTPGLQAIAVISVILIWLPVVFRSRSRHRPEPIRPARPPLSLIIRGPDGEIDLDKTAGRS